MMSLSSRRILDDGGSMLPQSERRPPHVFRVLCACNKLGGRPRPSNAHFARSALCHILAVCRETRKHSRAAAALDTPEAT